jgi:2'-5' RNA ligase
MHILTYWMIPAEPARSHFASVIRDLAARFDAPVFEPHMTVHATTLGKEDGAAVLEQVVADCPEYSLRLSGVGHSDEYTKTVFVQFHPSEALSRLSVNFREASSLKDEYELNPHVSLIYKTMPPEMKAEIAHSVRLPFEEVRFDSAWAVISPADIKSREDVEAWRVVATQKLTG